MLSFILLILVSFSCIEFCISKNDGNSLAQGNLQQDWPQQRQRGQTKGQGPLGGWDDEALNPWGGYPEDTSQWKLEDSIPGVTGQSYPNFDKIPDTSFDCRAQKDPGYYGDVESQCQVYHVCQAGGRQNSFLCPLGTMFNQETFVCDWWFNVNCEDTPNYYERNGNLFRGPDIGIDGSTVGKQKGIGYPGNTDQSNVGQPNWDSQGNWGMQPGTNRGRDQNPRKKPGSHAGRGDGNDNRRGNRGQGRNRGQNRKNKEMRNRRVNVGIPQNSSPRRRPKASGVSGPQQDWPQMTNFPQQQGKPQTGGWSQDGQTQSNSWPNQGNSQSGPWPQQRKPKIGGLSQQQGPQTNAWTQSQEQQMGGWNQQKGMQPNVWTRNENIPSDRWPGQQNVQRDGQSHQGKMQSRGGIHQGNVQSNSWPQQGGNQPGGFQNQNKHQSGNWPQQIGAQGNHDGNQKGMMPNKNSQNQASAGMNFDGNQNQKGVGNQNMQRPNRINQQMYSKSNSNRGSNAQGGNNYQKGDSSGGYNARTDPKRPSGTSQGTNKGFNANSWSMKNFQTSQNLGTNEMWPRSQDTNKGVNAAQTQENQPWQGRQIQNENLFKGNNENSHWSNDGGDFGRWGNNVFPDSMIGNFQNGDVNAGQGWKGEVQMKNENYWSRDEQYWNNNQSSENDYDYTLN